MNDFQQQMPNPAFNPKNVLTAPNCVCSACGHKLFREAVVLKKVSSLLTGTGKDELVPIPMYVCDKCGEILDDYKTTANYKLIMGEGTSTKNTDSSILL